MISSQKRGGVHAFLPFLCGTWKTTLPFRSSYRGTCRRTKKYGLSRSSPCCLMAENSRFPVGVIDTADILRQEKFRFELQDDLIIRQEKRHTLLYAFFLAITTCSVRTHSMKKHTFFLRNVIEDYFLTATRTLGDLNMATTVQPRSRRRRFTPSSVTVALISMPLGV